MLSKKKDVQALYIGDIKHVAEVAAHNIASYECSYLVYIGVSSESSFILRGALRRALVYAGT